MLLLLLIPAQQAIAAPTPAISENEEVKTMSTNPITLEPIGVVRHHAATYQLEIFAPWRPALAGLEGFSHLHVLWWSHLAADAASRRILTADTPYRGAPASLGILATRSPLRPNPIAISVGAIIHLDLPGGIITLDYLDAEDGTPVIDLKPYYPCSDMVTQVTTPAWAATWPQSREASASFDWGAVFINAC